MKSQKGFSVIELIVVLVTLAIIIAINTPILLRAGIEANLKAYYNMEVLPSTAEEKDAARQYMQKRLGEYQAIFDAVIAERTALTSAPLASTGPEVKERIVEIRIIAVRYDKAQDDLARARRVYYEDLAMEPSPEKK